MWVDVPSRIPISGNVCQRTEPWSLHASTKLVSRVLTVGRLVVFPGFEILAFPSNQFGGQEPGSNEQIKETACSRFKAEFPIFAKVQSTHSFSMNKWMTPELSMFLTNMKTFLDYMQGSLCWHTKLAWSYCVFVYHVCFWKH